MAQKIPALLKAAAKDGAHTRSFFQDDFPFIRKASIALGASIVLGAALIGGSGSLLSKQQGSKNQAQAQRNQAHEQYAQAENEKSEIRNFQPKYIQLLKRGIVGEEKRLDWIEHIRHIQEQRKLLPITYEISAQLPFQLDPSVQSGGLELRGSKILVHMNLLHEMDLLDFMNDLKAKGFYTPQACSIKRTVLSVETSLAPRLSAECTLYWVTLAQRTTATAEPPKAVAE